MGRTRNAVIQRWEHSRCGDECRGNEEALEMIEQDKRTKQNKKKKSRRKKRERHKGNKGRVNRPTEYHRLVIPGFESQRA